MLFMVFRILMRIYKAGWIDPILSKNRHIDTIYQVDFLKNDKKAQKNRDFALVQELSDSNCN